jgi:hypothetical protein
MRFVNQQAQVDRNFSLLLSLPEMGTKTGISMKLRSGLVAASLLVLVAGAEDAEAKRRGIPIFIPGGGYSETIVLVKDLPNIEALKRPDGKYIDLGYLHQKTGGKWIGHIGSDSEYMSIPPEVLDMIIKVSGMSKLPEPPPRPASSGGAFWTFMLVIGALVMAFKGIRFVMGRAVQGGTALAGSASALMMERESRSSIDQGRIEERLQAAASSYRNPAQLSAASFGQASFGKAPGTFGKR